MGSHKGGKGEIPYVYIYFYSRIKKGARLNVYVSPKVLLATIRRHLPRVPNHLCYPILCQMQDYGLLKRINQRKWKILDSDCEKQLEDLRSFSFW